MEFPMERGPVAFWLVKECACAPIGYTLLFSWEHFCAAAKLVVHCSLYFKSTKNTLYVSLALTRQCLKPDKPNKFCLSLGNLKPKRGKYIESTMSNFQLGTTHFTSQSVYTATLASSIQVTLYQETCQTFMRNLFVLQDMQYNFMKDQAVIQNTPTLY